MHSRATKARKHDSRRNVQAVRSPKSTKAKPKGKKIKKMNKAGKHAHLHFRNFFKRMDDHVSIHTFCFLNVNDWFTIREICKRFYKLTSINTYPHTVGNYWKHQAMLLGIPVSYKDAIKITKNGKKSKKSKDSKNTKNGGKNISSGELVTTDDEKSVIISFTDEEKQVEESKEEEKKKILFSPVNQDWYQFCTQLLDTLIAFKWILTKTDKTKELVNNIEMIHGDPNFTRYGYIPCSAQYFKHLQNLAACNYNDEHNVDIDGLDSNGHRSWPKCLLGYETYSLALASGGVVTKTKTSKNKLSKKQKKFQSQSARPYQFSNIMYHHLLHQIKTGNKDPEISMSDGYIAYREECDSIDWDYFNAHKTNRLLSYLIEQSYHQVLRYLLHLCEINEDIEEDDFGLDVDIIDTKNSPYKIALETYYHYGWQSQYDIIKMLLNHRSITSESSLYTKDLIRDAFNFACSKNNIELITLLAKTKSIRFDRAYDKGFITACKLRLMKSVQLMMQFYNDGVIDLALDWWGIVRDIITHDDSNNNNNNNGKKGKGKGKGKSKANKEKERLDFIKMILENEKIANSSGNVDVFKRDKKNHNNLFTMAVIEGHCEIVKYIYQYALQSCDNKKLNTYGFDRNEAMSKFVNEPCNHTDKWIRTPVYTQICKRGDTKMVKLLINECKAVDIMVLDCWGEIGSNIFAGSERVKRWIAKQEKIRQSQANK